MFCGGEAEQTMIIANKMSVIFEDSYLSALCGMLESYEWETGALNLCA